MKEFNKKSLEKSGISFRNKFLEKFRKEYSDVNPCGCEKLQKYKQNIKIQNNIFLDSSFKF